MTLLARIEGHAGNDPERIMLEFVHDTGRREPVGAGELVARSRRLAAVIRAKAGPGARVLLLCPSGVEFVVGFLACCYAGACAVPCLPPAPYGRGARSGRVAGIAADCGARAAIVLADDVDRVRGLAGVELIVPDRPLPEVADTELVLPDGEDLAFLQYTSGSTSSPRGVVLRHRHLVANLDMQVEAMGLHGDMHYVNWAPLYHDMGLIGVVLGALYTGARCTFMMPRTFADAPLRWLAEISATDRDVVTFAPNFAYDLCVDRVAGADRDGLDLSNWRLACNGSEQVRAHTVRRFSEHFAPAGFRPEAHTVVYGLAESTLITTAATVFGSVRADAQSLEAGQFAPAEGGRVIEVVDCGAPVVDADVRVIDPETRQPVADGEIGEVWLAGPHVADGYWERPEETAATFGARTADDAGPYLRTGDLAFRHDGRLFVTGRRKDVLIIRGRMIHPQDVIGSASAAHEACMTGFGCAFGVEVDGEERMVVVQGLRAGRGEDLPAIASAVRAAVVTDHEVEPHEVVLVRASRIPRTTSGKIRNGECRRLRLAGELSPLHVASAGTPAAAVAPDLSALTGDARRGAAESWLRTELGRLADLAPWQIDPETPLAALGIDSLGASRLRDRIRRELGVEPDPAAETLAELLTTVVVGPAAIPTAFRVRDDHEPFPLTDLQQAYVIGRSAAYELGGVATRGYVEVDATDLDPDRLRAAWQRVLGRHGMLRARLLADGRQQVMPMPVEQHIPVRDLRASWDEALQIREQMAHATPDPGHWPLWDIRISRLAGGITRLHLGFDLLVADLSSVRTVLADWLRWYREPAWAPAPVAAEFRDHVLAEADDQLALAYWKQRLEELPPPPALPQEQPTSAIGRPRFSRLDDRLAAPCWRLIRERAARAGVTPTAVLLAAYAMVLARWSAEPDLTIAVTVSNRRGVDENVVGDFTAVLPIAVHTGDDFEQLVRDVHARLRGDLAHVPARGMAVLRELAAARGSGTAALLPVVFTSGLGLPDLFSGFGRQGFTLSQTPQVSLDHQVFEDHGELVLSWDSVLGLFPAGLLDAAFRTYVDVLHQLADTDWAGLDPVRLPAGQQQTRREVNNTAGPLPDTTLWTAVADRAAAHPGAAAVITEERTVSYGELVGRAVTLAAQLRDQGVGPGTVVAIRLPKGWRQVVAVLGVVAAGGIYLPVDPDLPESRQEWLIEHAGAGHSVSEVDEATARWGPADWTCPAEPDQIAYIIYTSGSTGQPKGVAVTHRAALNTLDDICDRFGVTVGDAVLGLSALSFDLSVFDIFGMLGAGGRLVLPEPQARRDPAAWAELVTRHRITVWNSVPALASMLVEHLAGRPDRLPLRTVMLSGDWIPVSLPDRIRALAPSAAVISLGGATEAAVWSIGFPVDVVDESWESIPYGVPLRNQTFHVLDEKMRDRPDHVPGELYIGGAGVAECYWHDEQRTAASFVTRDGERLYRTGDLGRYRPDGVIEFLGRRDFQVKVGGFRIECGEVEHHLAAHPAVRQAVVAAVGRRHHQRLAAFVVPAARDLDGLAAVLRRPGVRDVAGERTALGRVQPGRDRRSHRRFETGSVPLHQVSALLSVLASAEDDAGRPLYRYGSAGGLYPVQAYLVADRVDGLRQGVHYHDPRTNELVLLSTETAERAFPEVMADLVAGAQFAVLLVGDKSVLRERYAERSRDFCLIEAGLVSQLLESTAERHGLGLCQVGGTTTDSLREPLRLTDDHELLHALVGGIPSTATEPAADLPGTLRAHLARLLPAYMVPSQITVVDRLPLTAQGKVDRGALTATAGRPATRGGPPVDPANDLERRIVEVFGSALGVDTVGVTDRFFELGATSVDLTRIHGLLRTRLPDPHGRGLKPLALFEHPTPRLLAEHLSHAGGVDRAVRGAAERAGARAAARRRTRTTGETQ